MKVLVLGKATERSEAGEFGSAEEFAAMDRYGQQLAEAGVVLAKRRSPADQQGQASRLRRRRQHHGDRRPVR